MIEKLFHTNFGRMIGVVTIAVLTWLGTVLIGHWHTKVASPLYVAQQVKEAVDIVQAKILIEDKKIKEDLLEIKIKSNNYQEKLFDEFQKMRESTIVFQTQISSDMAYLKKTVGDIEQDIKENENRLREVESRN
tara:strand:- start:841 stop:1242 length:402 start_codon:yes stop_codon:yes gene_type:complete